VRLPDFVIAGVPRCGTTTLAGHLRAQPQVFLPARKELHYFTLNRGRGLSWYAGHFADARPDQVCGEATPAYLLHPDAVEQLGRTLPRALVVVVLRDPADRAYSHYRLNQWKGVERRGFEAALAAEPARLARDPGASHFAYVGSGEYARLLGHLYTHVAREQVRVVMFDRLSTDPSGVLAELCATLGVDAPAGTVAGDRRNHHGVVRSPVVSAIARRLPGPACRQVRRWNTSDGEYPPMRQDTRRRLTEHFADANAGLAELIDQPLSWTSR
jgi:Sulfotransferase domain